MTQRLAIVVGSSGGIGRALLEAIDDRGLYDEVIALSRTAPVGWRGRSIRVDITNESSLHLAAQQIAETGAPTLVIIATGILQAKQAAPEKTYRSLSTEALQELLAVNVIGPALVAKHILPLMSRQERSVFAALSARVGSIGDNRLGGWYSYRASKAALNMLIKTLAIEHGRTHPLGICLSLHPGTVKTRLSDPFSGNRETVSPADSASALLNVLDQRTIADSGGFFGWDGLAIPW